jgi:hypothetical protein
MAQVYSQEVVVRVWRNVKTLGKVPTGHFGHAAVTVRGNFIPGGSQHISFWPKESAGIGMSGVRKQPGNVTEQYLQDKVSETGEITALRLEIGYRIRHGIPYPRGWDRQLEGRSPLMTPRPGQARVPEDVRPDELKDVPLWSQSADNKFYLPGIGAKGATWGLSTKRMASWWKQFQAGNPHYRALSAQNCAGVALWALRAGGSEALVPLPSVRIYAEPVQVERYAMGLLSAIERLDTASAASDRDLSAAFTAGKFKSTAPTPDAELSNGLWKSDVWKQRSALGTFAVRSGTIREIDAALEAFHAADWKDHFGARYKAMADMTLAIAKHRDEKPDSKRLEALLRLAAQINKMLRVPNELWQPK